ncbi:hypothetical protein BGI30_02490 [Snodgrassella alvi]|uniref:SdrD B-like domain-containing protein n=1 Tax=Snodgrassella alvi TaxID=1196083 RepID=UPI000CC4B4E1|nr:SdrD B-like domain-containing protein [Snodgrassella alvi]PIT12404.1 hypothetical protein BGI30_02490 [Snodgrassella alvi]PIT55422.1 hypothetical protein BHC59_10580 [Snodgrassella alvi]
MPAGLVFAQDVECAEVKIVIEQKLSFERQAFDARMLIKNGLDTSLKNIQVELIFTDRDNQPVEVTQKTDDNKAKFFYRINSLSGVNDISGTGQIAAKSNADIHWLIIPAYGAAKDKDTLYNIGARLTYELNGQKTTVDVVPDYVVVKPQPLLTLDYFLPGEVYGDDPFTAEEEPPIPFSFGVRVKNEGKGVSYKTMIDSAQPKIVENKKNLLVDFNILGSYIGNQSAGKSLLLNFGDIDAGATTVGRWNMSASLSGTFTDFNATFTHADTLGGAVTSLLKATNTHTLIHDVKVDLPDSDNVTDFLALDGDVVRLYQSNGADSEVTEQSNQAALKAASDGYQLTFPATSGFVYTKVADPFKGSKQPHDVVRSDGKRLLNDNVWLSKSRNKDLSWSYYVNVFDHDSTGQYKLFKHGVVQAKGIIAGKVYNDLDANGLLDNGEPGLSHIKVVLSGRDNAGNRTEQVTYTDDSGKFIFDKLPAGDYNIWVTDIEGMIDGPAVAGSAGGNAVAGKIEHIVLTENMHAENNLFAKQKANQPSLPGKADVSLNIELVQPDTVLPQDTVQLLLTISNQGSGIARNIYMQADLPDNLEITGQKIVAGNYNTQDERIDQLAAGESTALLLTVKITGAEKVGQFTARVNSETEDADLSNNQVSLAVQPGVADIVLEVEKLRRVPTLPDDCVQLLLTISNNGPMEARNIYLQSVLSSDLKITSQKVLMGNYNKAEKRVDKLSSGDAAIVLLTVKVNTENGKGEFIARVQSQLADPDKSNNSVTLPISVAREGKNGQ